jgi:Zn-dependent peptidase ImmA (M78 family)
MKSLKESAKNFIDKIDSDLKLIDTQEHKEEIIIEYKKELNVSKAITEVNNRYKQLEIIKQQEEKKKEIKQQEEQKSEEIKELIVEPPKEIKQEKIYELNFKVYGTKEQLVLLKQFLENGGYRYE